MKKAGMADTAGASDEQPGTPTPTGPRSEGMSAPENRHRPSIPAGHKGDQARTRLGIARAGGGTFAFGSATRPPTSYLV